jgi:N12 class adenine-specific DNA methylase
VSIVDPPRTFTRNGLQVTAVADGERKAPVAKWAENEHPRDREGKFIETFARVRVWGGKLATVLRNVGGGRIQIEYDDKTKATIHRNYLTVVKRPDGSDPTSKREAGIQALPEKPADPNAPELVVPDTTVKYVSSSASALERLLRDTDPELTNRFRDAVDKYNEALGNNVPDDEADERAALIDVLDEVDQKHGDTPTNDVRAQLNVVRGDATREPPGSPDNAAQAANDQPVTVRPAGQPDPGVPIPPPPAGNEKPQTETVAARTVHDGDVLHTRMGRVTVVGDPKKQPNQSYVLRLDRGDGKPPVEMTVRSRDRVDRETSPAATSEPPAPPVAPAPPQSGPVGAPNAQPLRPGADVTDTPSAPGADKPTGASGLRKYRTTKIGAREAAYAAEIMNSDGYQSGLTVDGQIVTVTDPESALFTLVGMRDIHSDNSSDLHGETTAESRRNARASATALTNLMNAIRRDYGIEGDGKPSPLTDGTPDAAETPATPNAPNAPDVPDVASPAAPQPPVKPERQQLDGFSVAESARIHNAVEDHAAQYYGSSLALSTNDAARYTSEGHLADLVAEHGLGKVWEAVASVIRDDPSVLERSQEDRDRNKADRDAKLDEINKAAGSAAQAGQWDEALRGLDEMETIDPTYRPGGLAIDDLRGRLTKMRDAEGADRAPDAPSAPDNAPEAPAAPQEPDTTPDIPPVATPDATPDTTPTPQTERRFPDANALREWLRNPDSIPPFARNDPDKADAARQMNARIASDPMLTMSAQGRLAVHRNPKPNGDMEWRIASPANGMWLGTDLGRFNTRDEALTAANLYESHVDANGKPFGWDQDDVDIKVRSWTDENGTRMPTLLKQDRKQVKSRVPDRRDFNDAWWHGEDQQQASAPDSGRVPTPPPTPAEAPPAPDVTPDNVPAATTPDAEADVDVPAVPPADLEPSTPAAPSASGDGRWNIAPVETTGNEETDKRALAANLRAAARAATTPEDRAALNWAARQLDPPKPRPRPAADGTAPTPRPRASTRTQARAQADQDVAVARRTRKPPVSAEARMAALADLADELDRLGLGSVAVTPSSDDGGNSSQTGGGRTSIVAALRQYVAEYKQRRAESASSGAGGDSGATGDGGANGSDSGTGGAALPEVPAEDVRGTDRPGGVLPESGGGSGPADRRPDGSDSGTGSAGRGVPGEGGALQDGAPVGGGTGDAGDGAARPGDGGLGAGPAGDGLPAVDGSAGAGRAADTGGPGVGGSDGGVPRGVAGTVGDASQPAAPEPVRVADAGLPAEGVTEADQPAPTPDAVPANVSNGEDFKPQGVDDFAPAGKVGKLNANIAALQTLRTLQKEKRPATPEEQAILAKWAGWGGLPEVFDPLRADYAPQRAELQGLLSESEWNEAKRNTLNAHYTDARVVQEVWNAVEALGFDGGRVLEPGSGSGTFIGFAPDNANMVGVELDSTTAALSQYLYPNATIRNESFARTNLPDGSFDATVGNVPFGNFQLTDRRHNKDNESIHNHFILKSMDLTRPGGLVAVLTSRYTLDSLDSSARRKMAEKGDLVGAVRLPTGSHQRASGTDVIEDLLIFRVRARGETPQTDQSWITSTKKPIDDQTIAVNDYWDEHPENVLGTMNAEKGRYGTGDLIVRGDRNMTDLPAVLNGIVEQAREDGLVATVSNGPRADLVDADESRHDGHIRVEEDGTFTQAVQGASVPLDVSASQRAELVSLVGLRDTLSRLLDAEASSRGITPEITNLRAQLNTQYDAYVAKNGPINRFKLSKTGTRIRPQQGGFRRDPMSAIVRALETYDPSTGTAEKASIFSKRAVAPRELRTSTDDPADAVSLSIDTYGEVNLPAIANMLGVDEDVARERLTGHVFEEPPTLEAGTRPVDGDTAAGAVPDPTGDVPGMEGVEAPSFTVPAIDQDAIGTPGKLEPSAAYLSGNVRRKLAIAQAAAAADPRFQANVDALKAVIPADLGADEINPRLGAAWIDKDTVQQFLKELIQDDYNQVRVSHSGGSIWTVDGPSYGNLSTEVWGTDKRSAAQLVQALLEQRSIKITKKTGPGRDAPSVPDLEATLAAQEKAEAIQERFGEWLWEDPERARKMQGRYNDMFNALVLRKYDGQARSFPGMSESWKPHDHVKDAVERIVNEPTALLAHVVGAGKTAEMVMGTAELKRLGMARKPAIVVPNHMLEQFTREYLEIYPNAKLLAAGSEDLRGDGRREFVGRTATGDWDAVILTQGAFESIPMSQEQQQAYIDREMATMRAQLAQAQADEMAARASYDNANRKNIEKTVKKMETALLRAEEALKKKMDKQKDVGVSFEQTGIDYLMVDEAHGYSNLRTLSNIQGAGATGSDKATDLHMKMEYLRETSKSGRVATFATGTPIRNTVTQAYVMQKFLRPDLLEEAGITSFDQWASTFGKTVDAMELKPEGTGFRQTTRFAKFQNVPEFLRMFHTFADVKLAEDLNLPTPNLVGGKATTVVVPSSDALAEYIADLGDRADMVRSGGVEPEEDNMLKISGDGRKAALSMKLVGGEHEPGKIEAAADRIASIWQENKGNVYTDPKTGEVDPIPGGMQIVFLDMGTPGSEDKWNGYDALKKELTDRGMDPSTIRYVHEAKNDAQKAELFAAARAGRISVLIGSSEKMGVGTNMQRRAVALHHLDAPWRPADLEQRDGRIMRQGNLNKDVQILRYVTEKSFDTFMWQTLERKAKFIHQIMRGSLDVREIDDIGDTALSHAEVKALSAGNPDLLEKAKLDNDLQLLQRAERTHNRTQTNLKSDIESQTRNAQVWESYAAQYDAALGQRVNTRGEAFTMSVNGSKYNKRADAADAFRGRLSSLMNQDRWGEAPERDLGTVGGFTVTGQVTPVPGGGRQVIVRFSGVPGEVTRVSTEDLGLSGIGLVTRLESALEAFEAKRDRLLQSAADARVEVNRMQERIGAGFPKAAELAAVRVRSQRINMKIERDARRSAGEDIPFDPLIDSAQYDTPLPGDEPAGGNPDDFGAVTTADLLREAEARAQASDTSLTDRSDQELADMLRSGPAADQAGRVMDELTQRAEKHAADSIAAATLAEPPITQLLQDVAGTFGGHMEGLRNRLKTQGSLSRKVRDKSLLKGRPQADIAAGMNDVLRYTMILDPDQYAAGAQSVLDGFVARGFTIVDADNTWAPGNVYQGINAVLRAPNGALFELQFHTPESFAAKSSTHADYELARDPSKTLEERQAAHDRMAVLQSGVTVPPNVAGVGTPQVYPRPTKALRVKIDYAKRVYATIS